MNSKYLIMATKSASTVSSIPRLFTEEQKAAGEMQKYIELKTKAGYNCHVFDYQETYKQETNLVKSSIL